MRSVRIVSDGTAVGTHIYDSATGAKLEGIQSLQLDIGLRSPARVTLVEKAKIESILVTETAVDEPARDEPRNTLDCLWPEDLDDSQFVFDDDELWPEDQLLVVQSAPTPQPHVFNIYVGD